MLGRPIFDPTDQRILDLNVPTRHSSGSHMNKTTATSSRIDEAAGGATTEDDEADSTNAKRAIGYLKDMKMAGELLPWLQVGIGILSERKEKNTQE
uniref:Uncharacterized protein n=1 Tax=Oryza meridionalis TaxID=40149 RepID=A0A0E0CPC5_9ORYZ